MINLLNTLLLSIFIIISLVSCNPSGEDTSELWKKSNTRGDIIERSGTPLRAGTDKDDLREQIQDAQNRLRSGGGLFGKKPLSLGELTGGKNSSQVVGTVGLPINPYLWKGSLETISFMPLASADPFAGVIITDWYSDQNTPDQRCKLNIFIKGVELKTNNLKVNSFCQVLNNNSNWIDQKIDEENNIKLENAILNQAKKIKLSQS